MLENQVFLLTSKLFPVDGDRGDLKTIQIPMQKEVCMKYRKTIRDNILVKIFVVFLQKPINHFFINHS